MEINSPNKRLKNTHKALLDKALYYRVPINIYGTHPHTLISPQFFTIDLRQYTDITTLIYTVHLTPTHLQYTEGLLTTACKYGYITAITYADTNPSIIDFLKPLFNGILDTNKGISSVFDGSSKDISEDNTITDTNRGISSVFYDSSEDGSKGVSNNTHNNGNEHNTNITTHCTNTPLNTNNYNNTLASITSPFYNPHHNFRLIFTSSTKLKSNNTVHIGPVTYTLPQTPLISLLNTFYPFNTPPTLQDTHFITRLTNRLYSLPLYTAIQQTYIITLKTLKEQMEVEEKIKGMDVGVLGIDKDYNKSYNKVIGINTPLYTSTGINTHFTFAPTSQSLLTLSALSSSILYKEPVLLIGETGVGKTHLIQHLSHINNKYLYIYNMSGDTDVSDLLGFYTSVHPISVIEEYVGGVVQRYRNETPFNYLERVERYIRGCSSEDKVEGVNGKEYDIQQGVNNQYDIQHPFNNLSNLDLPLLLNSIKECKNLIIKGMPYFKYQQGVMYKAMTEGKWLLLDEVNLSPQETLLFIDSIVERIVNSNTNSNRYSDYDNTGSTNDNTYSNNPLIIDDTTNTPLYNNTNNSTPLFTDNTTNTPLHNNTNNNTPTTLYNIHYNPLLYNIHPNFRLFCCMNPPGIGKKEYKGNLFSKIFMLDFTDSITDINILTHYLLNEEVTCITPLDNLPLFFFKLKEKVRIRELKGTYNKPLITGRTYCRLINMVVKGCCVYDSIRLVIYTQFCREGVSEVDSMVKGYNLHCECKGAGVEGVSDKGSKYKGSKYKGFSDVCSSYKGVKDSTDSYKGVNDSTYKQQGVKDTTYKQQGVSNNTDIQHPSSNSTTLQTNNTPYYTLTSSNTYYIEILQLAIKYNLPVLLQGPTCTGKTALITYISKENNTPLLRINNHNNITRADYIGTYQLINNTCTFIYGPLLHCMIKGCYLLLDELNLAPSEVLEVLNRVLDCNKEIYVDEIQQTIKCNKGFRVFCTQNVMYSGRKGLSEALRNRFVEVTVEKLTLKDIESIIRGVSDKNSKLEGVSDKSSKLEGVSDKSSKQHPFNTNTGNQHPLNNCNNNTPLSNRIVNKILSVYDSLRLHRNFNSLISIRDILRWVRRKGVNEEDLYENGVMLLFERQRNYRDRSIVKGVLDDVFRGVVRRRGNKVEGVSIEGNKIEGVSIESNKIEGVSIESSKIEGVNISTNIRQGIRDNTFILTPSYMRMHTLIYTAWINKEPILLIGETGIGKTRMLEYISNYMGVIIETFSCNSNTQTHDFIGYYTLGKEGGVSDRTTVVGGVKGEELEGVRCIDIEQESVNISSSNQHPFNYSSINQHPINISTNEQDPSNNTPTRITNNNTYFKYGPLVTAMRSGKAFLFDEINLTDDSVLERINSLLDDSSTLYIPETNETVYTKDTFILLATMNPGTDTGKKELSPALRSRFTEIYFDIPNSEIEGVMKDRVGYSVKGVSMRKVELVSEFYNIVSVKGVNNSTNEQQPVSDSTNEQHPFNTNNTKKHLFNTLLLNLKGTVTTYNTNTFYFIREESLELIGFKSNTKPILYENDRVFGVLPFLIEKYEELGVSRDNNTHTTRLVNNSTFLFDNLTTLYNLRRILKGMFIKKPILLKGVPGVGKTDILKNISLKLKIPFMRINMSEQTEVEELFGTYVLTDKLLEYKLSPLSKALISKTPYIILLDEINLTPSSVIEGVNSLLDYRKEISVEGFKISNFNSFIFCSCNYEGEGRKSMPRSFIDRFVVIDMESYTEEDIGKIIGCYDNSIDNNTLLDDNTRNNTPLDIMSLRTLYNLSLRDCLKIKLLNHNYLSINNPKYSIRNNTLYIGSALLPINLYTNNYVLIHKQLNALETIIHCYNRRVPVILLGCSRYSLIRFISCVCKHKVSYIYCYKGTDTNDLLGTYGFKSEVGESGAVSTEGSSYRGVNDKIDEQQGVNGKVDEQQDVNNKIYEQQGVNDRVHEQHPFNSISDTQHPLTTSFTWSDSPLVTSIVNGNITVINRVDLVDKGIFDRLCSLYEFNRSLYITERGFINIHRDTWLVNLVDDLKGVSTAMKDRCVIVDLKGVTDCIDAWKIHSSVNDRMYNNEYICNNTNNTLLDSSTINSTPLTLPLYDVPFPHILDLLSNNTSYIKTPLWFNNTLIEEEIKGYSFPYKLKGFIYSNIGNFPLLTVKLYKILYNIPIGVNDIEKLDILINNKEQELEGVNYNTNRQHPFNNSTIKQQDVSNKDDNLSAANDLSLFKRSVIFLSNSVLSVCKGYSVIELKVNFIKKFIGCSVREFKKLEGIYNKLKGVENFKMYKCNEIEGVSNKDSEIEGVSNSTYEQQGVSDTTNKQHPFMSNYQQHPFNTDICTPNSIPYNLSFIVNLILTYNIDPLHILRNNIINTFNDMLSKYKSILYKEFVKGYKYGESNEYTFYCKEFLFEYKCFVKRIEEIEKRIETRNIKGVIEEYKGMRGVSDSGNKQQGVNTSTYVYHPFNNSSNIYHPFNKNNIVDFADWLDSYYTGLFNDIVLLGILFKKEMIIEVNDIHRLLHYCYIRNSKGNKVEYSNLEGVNDKEFWIDGGSVKSIVEEGGINSTDKQRGVSDRYSKQHPFNYSTYLSNEQHLFNDTSNIQHPFNNNINYKDLIESLIFNTPYSYTTNVISKAIYLLYFNRGVNIEEIVLECIKGDKYIEACNKGCKGDSINNNTYTASYICCCSVTDMYFTYIDSLMLFVYNSINNKVLLLDRSYGDSVSDCSVNINETEIRRIIASKGGVSIDGNILKGVSIEGSILKGVINSTYKQQSVINTISKQHPFTNTLTPLPLLDLLSLCLDLNVKRKYKEFVWLVYKKYSIQEFEGWLIGGSIGDFIDRLLFIEELVINGKGSSVIYNMSLQYLSFDVVGEVFSRIKKEEKRIEDLKGVIYKHMVVGVNDRDSNYQDRLEGVIYMDSDQQGLNASTDKQHPVNTSLTNIFRIVDKLFIFYDKPVISMFKRNKNKDKISCVCKEGVITSQWIKDLLNNLSMAKGICDCYRWKGVIKEMSNNSKRIKEILIKELKAAKIEGCYGGLSNTECLLEGVSDKNTKNYMVKGVSDTNEQLSFNYANNTLVNIPFIFYNRNIPLNPYNKEERVLGSIITYYSELEGVNNIEYLQQDVNSYIDKQHPFNNTTTLKQPPLDSGILKQQGVNNLLIYSSLINNRYFPYLLFVLEYLWVVNNECEITDCNEEYVKGIDRSKGGVNEEGVSEEGVNEEGVSEEGVSEEGVSEEGVSEEGVSEEGVNDKGDIGGEEGVNDKGDISGEEGVNDKGDISGEEGVNDKEDISGEEGVSISTYEQEGINHKDSGLEGVSDSTYEQEGLSDKGFNYEGVSDCSLIDYEVGVNDFNNEQTPLTGDNYSTTIEKGVNNNEQPLTDDNFLDLQQGVDQQYDIEESLTGDNPLDLQKGVNQQYDMEQPLTGDNPIDLQQGLNQRYDTLDPFRDQSLDTTNSNTPLSNNTTNTSTIHTSNTLPPTLNPQSTPNLLTINTLSVNIDTLITRLLLTLHDTGGMRYNNGCYRSGRKLSIKRVVEYIASGYKRDRIFMRRNKKGGGVCKICIFIDNSRSMKDYRETVFSVLKILIKVMNSIGCVVEMYRFGSEVVNITDESEMTFTDSLSEIPSFICEGNEGSKFSNSVNLVITDGIFRCDECYENVMCLLIDRVGLRDMDRVSVVGDEIRVVKFLDEFKMKYCVVGEEDFVEGLVEGVGEIVRLMRERWE